MKDSVTWIDTNSLTHQVMGVRETSHGRGSRTYSSVKSIANLSELLVKQGCDCFEDLSLTTMIRWLSMTTGSITTDGNSGYMHQPPIDRTRTCKTPFRFRLVYDLPRLLESRLSFEEVCIKRVADIVSFSNSGRPIIVMWSGGLDSTCILAAFIKRLGIKEAAERVIVCCNEFSVIENPVFYNKLVKPNFRVLDSSRYFVELIDYQQCIIVNGDPGGALEGGGALRTIVQQGLDLTSHNWKDDVKKVYGQIFNVKPFTHLIPESDLYDNFVESIVSSATAAGVEIHNSFDCFWWYLLNFKWQSMSLNLHRTCENLFESVTRSVGDWKRFFVPFFAHEDFQIWSFSNREALMNEKIVNPWPIHYKHEMRSLIYSLDRNYDYFSNKGKEAKLHMMIRSRPRKMFAMTSNFKPLFRSEDLCVVKP